MSVHFLGALGSPRELVERPQIEPEVKRAILASWASDAFVVRSAPTLRKPPELPEPVAVVDILDALKGLDQAAPSAEDSPGGLVKGFNAIAKGRLCSDAAPHAKAARDY